MISCIADSMSNWGNSVQSCQPPQHNLLQLSPHLLSNTLECQQVQIAQHYRGDVTSLSAEAEEFIPQLDGPLDIPEEDDGISSDYSEDEDETSPDKSEEEDVSPNSEDEHEMSPDHSEDEHDMSPEYSEDEAAEGNSIPVLVSRSTTILSIISSQWEEGLHYFVRHGTERHLY